MHYEKRLLVGIADVPFDLGSEKKSVKVDILSYFWSIMTGKVLFRIQNRFER